MTPSPSRVRSLAEAAHNLAHAIDAVARRVRSAQPVDFDSVSLPDAVELTTCLAGATPEDRPATLRRSLDRILSARPGATPSDPATKDEQTHCFLDAIRPRHA